MLSWILSALSGCGDDPADETGAPPADELQTVDLGTFDLGDTGWYSEDIAVEVPVGAVSSVMTCGAFGPAAIGAVFDLTAPDGTVVYDGNAPDAWPGFRSDYLDDEAPALLPVTPVRDTEPGTWMARWFVSPGHGGASVNCRVVHRVDAVSAAPAVHLELVFVGLDGLNGLNASAAPGHVDFQAALTTLTEEWATAGIVASWSYRDFDGDVDRFAVVDVTDDDASELNALLATANPTNPRTVTFFFVQEISSGSGGTILGLAGGPPGTAGLNGTSKSGVVITTADLQAAPTDVGKIMAHEGGHYLGLFHTTERPGDRFDPLPDTPECTPESDFNANGEMNSDECADLGASNVMWWTLTTAPASFSVDQTWVLARNPATDG